MKVRYQFVVEITADGLLGPLRVQELLQHALNLHLTVEVELGKVRCASVYTLAPADESPVAGRVPGSDQSREVEAIKDPRIT